METLILRPPKHRNRGGVCLYHSSDPTHLSSVLATPNIQILQFNLGRLTPRTKPEQTFSNPGILKLRIPSPHPLRHLPSPSQHLYNSE